MHTCINLNLLRLVWMCVTEWMRLAESRKALHTSPCSGFGQFIQLLHIKALLRNLLVQLQLIICSIRIGCVNNRLGKTTSNGHKCTNNSVKARGSSLCSYNSTDCMWSGSIYLLFVGLTKASVSVSIGAKGAPLRAHSPLQHVALHALQAVSPQGAFTGVAAPVTLCKQDGR